MISFILILIITAVIAVFSVQNAYPVKITFVIWSFEASLAIVIFLSVLAGLLMAAVLSLPGKIRRMSKDRAIHKPDVGTPGPR
ncbi:MAG: LapA family protein [Nitrospirota bacterium]